MFDTLRRLVWFFIVASAISYGVFLISGTAIKAQALDDSRIVSVRDSLKPGVHYLSGMVMVHRTCADLAVRYEKVEEGLYKLIFTTWEDPSIPCATDDTPRAFRAAVAAPAAGVTFIGSLDDEPLQLSIYQLVDTQS